MRGFSSRPILAAASVLAISSCGFAGRAQDDEFAEPEAREVTLRVRNHNFYDATLYALSAGGQRLRLGITRGNGEETFSFRWPHMELRVVIDLLAVGASFTESIAVSEGDELELIIRPDLHLRTRRSEERN